MITCCYHSKVRKVAHNVGDSYPRNFLNGFDLRDKRIKTQQSLDGSTQKMNAANGCLRCSPKFGQVTKV